MLAQLLTCCVTPGMSLWAGPAPMDIKGSRIGLLGLMQLTGNSNAWLSKALPGLWLNDANKAQSTDLFICLFEVLLKSTSIGENGQVTPKPKKCTAVGRTVVLVFPARSLSLHSLP